jgi:hypothetical protein
MIKAELLAPAGDMESVDAAARFGADAVFIGGDFLQLRAKKAGFTREDVTAAADFLHARGKKLYVTVNSFAKNDEIAHCGDYARFLRDAGADAAIISDLGVMAAFAKAAPELDIHVSTQANCMNYGTAKVYADLGAKRIVLAREMTLQDIADLRAHLDPQVELEAFVHGAMCMAYSGRCILSSYLAGRSGNRGECTQSCRWNYALVEEKRPGEYIPIEEEDGHTWNYLRWGEGYLSADPTAEGNLFDHVGDNVFAYFGRSQKAMNKKVLYASVADLLPPCADPEADSAGVDVVIAGETPTAAEKEELQQAMRALKAGASYRLVRCDAFRDLSETERLERIKEWTVPRRIRMTLHTAGEVYCVMRPST